MSDIPLLQSLNPNLTTWHITFGTYGTRLHGSEAPTVDKEHNAFGEAFLESSPKRAEFERNRTRFPAILLTPAQREFVESTLSSICERGGWGHRVCSAATDHIHLLCDVQPDIHGEKVRRLVKRWLGQALSERWPLPAEATWWADEGSNKAIHDKKYLNNAFNYIARQRATPLETRSGSGTSRLTYRFHVNLFASSFTCTWEDAAARLETLPRMIFEPDGSWIWSGEADGAQWHVNGHLFDFSGTLHRVELSGWCPADQFDRLLACFGWPETRISFEMVREGLQFTEAQFRAAMLSA